MMIEVAGGLTETGIVVGNTYDKYSTTNLVARWLMQGFDSSLNDLVASAGPKSIHDVGCGEGYWTLRWQEQGYQVKGSDFSRQVIDIARSNAGSRGVSAPIFQAKSIYDMTAQHDRAELIVCCEVLEHLDNPERALEGLRQLVDRWLIISVPREPIWRALNMARGKYWGALGNTPGHIQHWSKSSFVKLVSRYFNIVSVKSPLPWTMLLAKPK